VCEFDRFGLALKSTVSSRLPGRDRSRRRLVGEEAVDLFHLGLHRSDRDPKDPDAAEHIDDLVGAVSRIDGGAVGARSRRRAEVLLLNCSRSRSIACRIFLRLIPASRRRFTTRSCTMSPKE
jgi:hypothetical protein